MADEYKYKTLQLKRGNKSTLENFNLIFAEGEPILELDTGEIKFGDGVHKYTELPYFHGQYELLPDGKSIVVEGSLLVLKGFSSAETNQVAVKNGDELDWMSPFTAAELNDIVK